MSTRHSNSRWNLVGTGVGLMLAFWVADSFLDGFLFSDGGFVRQLVHPGTQELAYRLQTFCFLLFLIVYARRKALIQERLTLSLEEALTGLAAEKNRSEAILAAVPDALSVQDTDLKILYQNPAHKKLMGDHAGEFCYVAYQHSPAVCPGCHLVGSFSDGLLHQREVSYTGEQGERHVEIFSVPLKDAEGRIIAGIESVRDITQRKKAEEKIRMLNESLGEQALVLQATNQELEAFSYSLSHDLRSPLTGIFTAAQALDEMYRDKLDGTGKSLLQGIRSGCENMEELIEAMLVLFRATRSELSCREVDLSGLANEIMADLQLRQIGKPVAWSIEPGLTARLDPHLARILLENLLGNAWKYSARSDHPTITFGRNGSDGVTEFYVRDNGVGFDMRDAAKIFLPFQRLHGSGDFPGTGIGLATVKRIIDRHGGRIRAAGEVGKGATFYFSVPEEGGGVAPVTP